MAWPKGKKRFASSSHNGRLMIVLRNRHTIWIDVGPDDGPALRASVQHEMNSQTHGGEHIFDFAPYSQDTVRLEDIVHVKYQPPKSASESEPEPKAKPS